MTRNDFNRALWIGLLFTALLSLSQPTSFAGFGNMFGSSGGTDKASTASADHSGQKPFGDFRTTCEMMHSSFGAQAAYARKNIERGEMMMMMMRMAT